MSESDITLRVANVTKRFGDFTAVEDLSFNVRAGRVFGFLGPNGAGKTTTIRMIVGITAPDEGTIELFGQRMSSDLQNRIGYLPEERGLYKKMKIVDQLRYFAALKGMSSAEADKKIDFWLERMKLSEWKKKKTTDLSKGMQQKIQFISTVLHDPDLLILDEPFSGLDPINVEFMIEVLAEFKTQDKTIIFSTHLMETAERLCHDILLINKARKVVSGSLREVKESYGVNLIAFRGTKAERVLADKALIEKAVSHADEQELHLAKGVVPQQLLKVLIDAGAEISKFEITEPSLNDIFIEKVGGVKAMRKFLAVVKHEYKKVVLKWSFLIGTLLLPLLASLFAVVPAIIFSLKGEPTRIAVVDTSGKILPRLEKNLSADKMMEKAKKAAKDSLTELNASQEEKMRNNAAQFMQDFKLVSYAGGGKAIEDQRTELIGKILAGEIDAYLIVPADIGSPDAAFEFRSRQGRRFYF